ncbi:hypothetical protein PVAND_007052 [Polypedilum vanderplanki]|uniref:Carboxypeptidase n=1 Tax=Polypedilum vanderplanki TaxID=319348 RepID=A0A9J6C5I5_POLVA|nr:hypothetical protein PVAND_007052 [Polypedilum vanderplanki]
MFSIKLLFALYLLQLSIAYDVRYDGFPTGNPQNWGFVNVREGAYMFWWMHFAKNVTLHTDRPIIFWLQGGPGSSSTGYGNFEILGPLDLAQQERNFTWVNTHNVLFVDNPVGTGFSYVDDLKYLSTDNKQIAKDLIEVLRGFYELYPDFKTVPLHIFGESYGGKMAIEFAYELNKEIQEGKIDSNLIGVYLGDAWTSPIDYTLSWAPYLLNLGFVDEDGYQKINNMARRTERVLQQGQYVLATDLWYMTEVILEEEARAIDFYNVQYDIAYRGGISAKTAKQLGSAKARDYAYELMVNYRRLSTSLADEDEETPVPLTLNNMMRNVVHPALKLPEHVIFGSQSGPVFDTLAGDFMKPVVHIVEKVLNETNVKVVVYNGQLDLICSTPGTIKWVNGMNWYGKKQYASATRNAISVNGLLEGYVRKYGRFAMYWLNRSGHMAPFDNPRACSVMLREETNFPSDY